MNRNAYLGQKPPNDTPKIFGGNFSSLTVALPWTALLFSANGREFYYLNAQHWFQSRGSRLRYLKYDGKKWQRPFDVLTNGCYAPSFTPDGKGYIPWPVFNTPGFGGYFYVASDEYYMVVSYKEKKDYECEPGITFRKPDHTWNTPMNLGPLINDGDAHRWGEYVSPDGKYLFYSKGTSEKDGHLYWVRFDQLKERLTNVAF